MDSPRETTVQEYLDFLAPDLAQNESPPAWPPDAFALAAALLLESGAYLTILSEWPRQGASVEGYLDTLPDTWAGRLQQIGLAWRSGWQDETLPEEVRHWWAVVRSHGGLPLPEIDEQKDLCCALLQILAAADEASSDAGIPGKQQDIEQDRFRYSAEKRLLPSRRNGSTLCKRIHPSKLRVLPKFHTPQTGMTLRSLSHNIALWTGSDVTPLWFTTNLTRPLDPRYPEGPSTDCETHGLNLLLIPWPTTVLPRQFQPVRPPHGRMFNMPKEKFGFFTYRREANPEAALKHVQKIYESARKLTDHIDGVVFPELALEESEYEEVRRWVTSRKSFLIAGVGTPCVGDQPGQNRVRIEVPVAGLPIETPDGGVRHQGHTIRPFQDKHHRWRLNRGQIVQYGLGGQLDPAKSWWEHTEAKGRHLTFVSLQPWLSMCALVCEDLARQDPVADLVRAVGPNLVIALLMDGPQLAFRWPGRYATVLADDPGSSVLSFTSIGMCEFSRPPGKPASRTVALWKDATSSDPIPIDLPPGADAVLLNLARQMDEEWTADGRSDGGSAGIPTLAGVHPVSMLS